ncbi:MAG TPA: hypothetical protein VF104_05770, partial [Burkholderiales bacterium]
MTATPFAHRVRPWLLAAFLLGLACAAAALWGRSEPALRWAAERIVAWSAGRIALEGVGGSVLGPLRIARLSYRSPEGDVTAEGVEADWSPLRLVLERALEITRLEATRVEVLLKPGDAPLELPQDLRPPLPFSLARLSVPRIELRGLGPEVLVRDLKARLEADASGYRLDIASLQLPWASLAGGARVGTRKPFALGGELAVGTSYAGESFTIQVRLSGSLEAAEIAASLDHAWGKGSAAATLTPFSERPLRDLRVELSGMDPARHGKGYPAADLAARLAAAPAASGLAGKLEIENRAPGRLDQGRLPLAHARAGVALADGELRFDDMVITLAGAGTLEGAGRAAGDRAEFRLRSAGLALNALHGSLKPLRPTGTVILTGTRDEQAARAELTAGEYRLQVDASHHDAVIAVRSATLRARGSELEVTGELRVDGAQNFTARGNLRSFNPAQWGEFPKARLNARLEAKGELAPQLRGTLRYDIVDSQYLGAPLSGAGSLAYSGKQSLAADGHLALGDNRLSFTGAVGGGERLSWNLDAASLSVLGPDFSGKAVASGWFAGSLDVPSFKFDIQGNRLRLPGNIAAGTLQASGEYVPGGEGILRGRIEAQKAQLSGQALDFIEAAADGTPPRHAVSISVRGAELDVQAGAEGGLDPGPRWSGRLLNLTLRKPLAGSLASPAPVAIARNEFEVGAAELNFGNARVAVERVSWREGRL